jgi:hypothetical protein
MVQLFVVLIVVAASVAAFYIGKSKASKLAPPAPPKPKVFGAYEARQLRADLGGTFRPGDGRVVKLAMLASGIGFQVVEDASVERQSCAATIAAEQETIKALLTRIDTSKATIESATAEDADAASLAGVFSEA